MDELDEFMKSLENAGILSGWSEFMAKSDNTIPDDTETQKGEQYDILHK